MAQIKYSFDNLKISGGGYVTGLEFGGQDGKTLYARTDIGGIYRYDRGARRWHSMMEAVGPDRLECTYPLAIACGDGGVYAAAGSYRGDSGVFLFVDDGEVRELGRIPCRVHGNNPGRGSGKRLVCLGDGAFLFASQSGGLLKTTDCGKTWERLAVPEINTTFVYVGSGDADRVVVVGCSGKYGEEENPLVRAHCLYGSCDGGETFEKLPVPAYPSGMEGMQGYVAYRYASCGSWLYVTMFGTAEEPGRFGMDAYGTDSVHALACARLIRYRFEGNALAAWEDVTPEPEVFEKICGGTVLDRERYPFGFGGVAASGGVLALALTGGEYGSTLLRSLDGGRNWEIVMHGVEVGDFSPVTPYLKLCNNDGINFTHWMNDLCFNPEDNSELWYVTGTGTFYTQNFLENVVRVTDNCDGLEETVHINVYALPMTGDNYAFNDINVVDAIGDIGAFVFKKSDEHCASMVKSETGSGYVTAMNADYSDKNPDFIAITPRGNWRGTSRGGVVVSENGGSDFIRLPMPTGFSSQCDALIEEIEKPNRNSGWCAVGCDGRVIYQLARGHELPHSAVFFTDDLGKTWHHSRVHAMEGLEPSCLKIFASRINPDICYGFGEDFRVYLSTDGGENFYEKRVDCEKPHMNLSYIEYGSPQIRGEAGSDRFYVAAANHGLLTVFYDEEGDCFRLKNILGDHDRADTVGIGIGRGVSYKNYEEGGKCLYISGVIDGTYGFYRSVDYGRSWERIGDDSHLFGQIRSIDGDCRVFGRFYIATGTMGLIMGEEYEEDRKDG